jgi:hypothetical protein
VRQLTIPGATLSGTKTEVRMRQADQEILCPFWPGDGAQRLLGMLKTDAAMPIKALDHEAR